MQTLEKTKRGFFVLKKISVCILIIFFFKNCFSATTSSTSIPVQDSVITPPTLGQPLVCVFNFEDNYYGTDSGINPPSAPYQPYGSNNYPGYFGPIVQLKFNNYNNAYLASQYSVGYGSPTQYTPNLPCDGHYEVSFSVELRNNSGTACNSGENSMSIWSTTTDPASPNAYGCPVSYIDIQGHPQSSPSATTSSVNACATFSQWVQCAWTNNFNASQQNTFGQFEYYGVQAFPIFLYTTYWPYVANSRIHSQYPGMCSEYTGDPAWAWYYNQFYGCYEAPGYFLSSYQTAFCASKTYYFKNVIYLHAGAQISAPAMASQQAFTAWSFSNGAYAQCSFSVVGGKFKVVYLGP